MPDNSTLKGIGDGIFSAYGGINPIFGNIMAGMKNAEAQKKKESLIANYGANAEAKYNQMANQDFLDTNVASSMMTRIKERLKNANNMADKQAATTGATNEAILAAKTANQGQFNDVVSQVAGMGTARADQIEGRHMNQEGQILGLNVGLANDDIQAAQTQAANANSTMQSIIGAASTLSGVPGVGAIAGGGSNQLMGGLSADQALTNTSVQIAAPATMESQFGYDAAKKFASSPPYIAYNPYDLMQFIP
jgi:hypothetical protein